MSPWVDQHNDPESFDTFLSIVAQLRGPKGCPWDKEQTHASVAKYLLQECHEAIEAIEDEEPAKLADELGDLLLQIGLNAQIAQDQGGFTIKDVLRSINQKLIRRHPHVFGSDTVSGPEEVVANWQSIKNSERGTESTLDGIPRSLPSLAASQEIQTRAAHTGFDWPDMQGVLEKVREEISEFQNAHTSQHLEHELGDIIIAIVNIGRKLNIDTEGAVRKANERFRKRFSYMEQAALQQGKSLDQLTIESKEMLWQEAKRGS